MLGGPGPGRKGRRRQMSDIYADLRARSPANHAPLSPVAFLERAAAVWPGKTAVVHGERRITYAEFHACRSATPCATASWW